MAHASHSSAHKRHISLLCKCLYYKGLNAYFANSYHSLFLRGCLCTCSMLLRKGQLCVCCSQLRLDISRVLARKLHLLHGCGKLVLLEIESLHHLMLHYLLLALLYRVVLLRHYLLLLLLLLVLLLL